MFDYNTSRRIVKVRSQIRKSVQKNKLTYSVQPKQVSNNFGLNQNQKIQNAISNV